MTVIKNPDKHIVLMLYHKIGCSIGKILLNLFVL